MNRLLALSDLHVGYAKNREALAAMAPQPDAGLVVAGDIGETDAQLAWTFDLLTKKFARLYWTPGNHELWTPTAEAPRGDARYRRSVEIARAFGVRTPEDPFDAWPGLPLVIAPVFVGYDYSFGPDGFSPAEARAWAAEEGIRCADETYLYPDPFPTREAWCAERVRITEARLAEVPPGTRIVLIAHWPLRRDLVRLYRIPRFIVWCGTRATEDWHRRFPIDVVVSGHLHMRATDWRDGVRFEEVSLGYPAHWKPETGPDGYLRTILPRPPVQPDGGPVWHR